MDRRTFIKYFSFLSFAAVSGFLAFDFFGKRKKFDFSFYEKNPDYKIFHVEIHLVEHCNLNCKFCSHMSCIAEKHFYNVKMFEKDMARLAEVTQSRITEIQLLGGEPLLHPQITDIVRITRTYFPDTRIDILNNGTLLNSMSDEFWKTVKKYDVCIVPTIYPVEIDWASILNKAKKFGVNVMTDGRTQKITLDNIKDLTVKKFYKLSLDIEGKQPEYNPKCVLKKFCVNFIEGKLYHCFVSSNIKHFNKKFGKNIPVQKGDYLDVYRVNSADEVAAFFEQKNIPFCKYCFAYVDQNEPWCCTNEHSIDEWVYKPGDTCIWS